jgi:hypothetical protein
MGQLDSNVQSPTERDDRPAHGVAVQAAFEKAKANFETRISQFQVQGLKPGAFKAMGQLDS